MLFWLVEIYKLWYTKIKEGNIGNYSDWIKTNEENENGR